MKADRFSGIRLHVEDEAMGLSRAERETIVRTSDADDFWIISTASPRFIRKFARLGYEIDDTSLPLGEYKTFKVPLNVVSFRRPRQQLSPKEIAARKGNLRKEARLPAATPA
jgi:hypothetical protein